MGVLYFFLELLIIPVYTFAVFWKNLLWFRVLVILSLVTGVFLAGWALG